MEALDPRALKSLRWAERITQAGALESQNWNRTFTNRILKTETNDMKIACGSPQQYGLTRAVALLQSIVQAVRFAPGRPHLLASVGSDRLLQLHDRRLDAVVRRADAQAPLTALAWRSDGLLAAGTAG